MALIRSPFRASPAQLRAKDVYLRLPEQMDYPAWQAVRHNSRDFLQPWEPSWPADDLAKSSFRRRVRRYQDEWREKSAYTFFLFRHHDDALIGGLSLTNVRRGVAQSCNLGYWMGAEFAGCGLMSQGVGATIPFVFNEVRLHRIRAGCLLHNDASIGLLERHGFQREGIAREYLCINGRWQDHYLYALLDSDYRRSFTPSMHVVLPGDAPTR
jgi:ribosomal-protein-alanine N-acetyltransferase